jgi:hypothetical protein
VGAGGSRDRLGAWRHGVSTFSSRRSDAYFSMNSCCSREDYHLTEKGADLLPALIALLQWGDRWVRPDGGRIALTHAGCGSTVLVEVRCTDGHPASAETIEAARRS